MALPRARTYDVVDALSSPMLVRPGPVGIRLVVINPDGEVLGYAHWEDT